MSESETQFHTICTALTDAEKGQLFGKPCYKIGGKAFACFFEDCMVFKLSDDAHSNALARDGAQLFDPSKKGRPMKEWVQVPFDYADQWGNWANSALAYVKGN